MIKKYSVFLLLLAGIVLTAGCGNEPKKPVPSTVAVARKPALTDPFRFHKRVEVSPGQDYDVLSWGRGSSKTGAFLILHSDSANARYTTTTGDLDGAIVDVYNSDMDLDGNPEILIEAKGKDTINYTTIYAFEFNGSKARTLDFPHLTKSQKKGYRGDDNFYIKEGVLYREFPIYSGKDAKPTGEKRLLQYGLRDNSFTVKQLSKDAAIEDAGKPVARRVQTPEPERKHASSKKAKKHTAEKKHKKKKRRRHNSGE